MSSEDEETYFARRVEQELELVSASADPAVKAIHLDLAARYATQHELAERARLRAGSAEGTDGREAV